MLHHPQYVLALWTVIARDYYEVINISILRFAGQRLGLLISMVIEGLPHRGFYTTLTCATKIGHPQENTFGLCVSDYL
jgi:hypothetical protein